LAKIQFFQNQVAIIADLKANEKYTIQTGNQKLHSPEYDLENFKNSIDNNLPEAKIYDIKQIPSKENSSKNKSFWQQSWFMWLCIGLGGITIAFFTTSLVKDMNNKSSI
jgi:23S rRNA A1618 N6-methylase RlmF